MAATVENLSDGIDAQDVWKTYYVCIRVDGDLHYKFGTCKGTIKRRYAKEPAKTEVQILKIWHHPTEQAAFLHKEQLFEEFPGDRPYIGRCGPLVHGGNTDTYSHDVMGGESAPHTYIVRLYSLQEGCLHTLGYSGFNPRKKYHLLYGTVKYMEYSFGPEESVEGPYLQVPQLSSEDSVTIATANYLEDLSEGQVYTRGFPKKWAFDALERYITIRYWSDYCHMEFEGAPFKPNRYADWV